MKNRKAKNPPILLLDIDGSLADANERFKFAGPEPDRAYPEEHAAWVIRVQDDERLLADKPIPLMQFLVSRLASQMRVVYLTARHEKHLKVTVTWLAKHGFPNGEIFMRPNDNYESTVEFKDSVIRLLHAKYKQSKIVTIDDDPSGECSLMYRGWGITHLKMTYCAWDLETGEVLPAYAGVPATKKESA